MKDAKSSIAAVDPDVTPSQYSSKDSKSRGTSSLLCKEASNALTCGFTGGSASSMLPSNVPGVDALSELASGDTDCELTDGGELDPAQCTAARGECSCPTEDLDDVEAVDCDDVCLLLGSFELGAGLRDLGNPKGISTTTREAEDLELP